MRIILKKGGLGVLIVAVAGLTACSTTSGGRPSSTGPVHVVAAENFWGSIARQLAGSDAQVTSIITNPATDPHDYEATAGDARSLAAATLVIENGIGYDAWAERLLAANPVAGRQVLDVGRVLGIAPGGNPHQWYSRTSVLKVVASITADLTKIDPTHRADYTRNERAYETTGLASYNALIAQIRAHFHGAPIGASESIVAPLAATLGLKLLTPEGFLDAIAEGTEPTANDKITADTQIRDRKIDVFVYNSQNATPDVHRLVDEARHEHIPVATVTETLSPANLTFQAWQEQELRALLDALRAARSVIG